VSHPGIFAQPWSTKQAAAFHAKRWSVYEDRAAEPQLDAEGEQTNAKHVLFPT
jgi:hypothetical protein